MIRYSNNNSLEHLLPDDRWIIAITAGHNFVRKGLPRGEVFCYISQQQIQKVNWSCVEVLQPYMCFKFHESIVNAHSPPKQYLFGFFHFSLYHNKTATGFTGRVNVCSVICEIDYACELVIKPPSPFNTYHFDYISTIVWMIFSEKVDHFSPWLLRKKDCNGKG